MKAVACKMQLFRKVPDYELWFLIINVKNLVTQFGIKKESSLMRKYIVTFTYLNKLNNSCTSIPLTTQC